MLTETTVVARPTPMCPPRGVSVVIPTYNRTDALLQAVASVRTVQAGRVEIVVIDDGSAVDPLPLLPARNDSGVTVRGFRLPRNSGPQAARNLGVRRARFSHVAFLDSDDAFMPDKVDRVLGVLDLTDPDLLFHPVVGMAKCNRLGRLWHHRLKRVVPLHWWAVLYNPAATPGLVVRRAPRLGLPTLRHSEDWSFVLRNLRTDSRVVFLDEELAMVYRGQGTSGGLSGAVWHMRKGEFKARRVLLRRLSPGGLLRFVLGTAVGGLRLLNDLVRWRYWRHRTS